MVANCCCNMEQIQTSGAPFTFDILLQENQKTGYPEKNFIFIERSSFFATLVIKIVGVNDTEIGLGKRLSTTPFNCVKSIVVKQSSGILPSLHFLASLKLFLNII
jgi:hypothetical protein